jgi:hypothetical protein
VRVSVLLTAASVHDSQTAVPLATMTAARVTNLCDLMDAALQEHSRSLGHVPLIDNNARGGEKDEFEPADAARYKERKPNGVMHDSWTNSVAAMSGSAAPTRSWRT